MVIAGQRFGRLTAVARIGKKQPRTAYEWLFECDCGTKKEIPVGNVTSGRTKSCGCLIHDRLKPGEAQLNYLYGRCKWSAGQREIHFCLTKDQFFNIVTKPCHFCGAQPKFQKQRTYRTGMEVSGVDRVNSAFGYADWNCVPCCSACNFAKQQMSVQEFKDWVSKVYMHLIGGNQ